jgi:hypothetical protein
VSTRKFNIFEVIVPLVIVSSAKADLLLRLSDSVTVWNGGIAWNNGNGWYGQGWDRFPGVSPPWNPVAAEPPTLPPAAPVVTVVPEPVPVAPSVPDRSAPPLTLGCDGTAVPVQIRW